MERCKFSADGKDYDCEKWKDKKCLPETPDNCFGYRDEGIEYCPDDCEHLSVTEKQQNKREGKPPHICQKHDKRVMHGGIRHHPKLIKLSECEL